MFRASGVSGAFRRLIAGLGLVALSASPLRAASPDSVLDLLDTLSLGPPASAVLSRHPTMRPVASLNPGTTMYSMPLGGPYFSEVITAVEADNVANLCVLYSTGLVAVNGQNALDVVRWAPEYVAALRRRYGEPVSSGTWSFSSEAVSGAFSREQPEMVFLTWKVGSRFTTASFESPAGLVRGARLAVDQRATFTIHVTTTAPETWQDPRVRVRPFSLDELKVSTRAAADSLAVRPTSATARLFPSALKGLYLGLPYDELIALRPTQKDDFLWDRDSPLEDWLEDPLFTAAEHRTRARALAATTVKAESVSKLALWCADHWGPPSALYQHTVSSHDTVPTEASIFVWDFPDARTALRWGQQKGAYGWYPVAEILVFDRSVALENAIQSAAPPAARTLSSRQLTAEWNALLRPPDAAPAVRVLEMAASSATSGRPPPSGEKDFAPDVRRLSVWMSVSASTPSSLIHAWYRDDMLVEEIPLRARAGSSWHHSRKEVLGPGRWHVVAREASGRELGRTYFNIWQVEAGGCLLSLKEPEAALLNDGYRWSKGSLRCPPSIWLIATRLTDEGHAGWWTSAGGARYPSDLPLDVLVRLPRGRKGARKPVRAITEAHRVSASSSHVIEASSTALRLASGFSLSAASWTMTSDGLDVNLKIAFSPRHWPLGPGHLSFALRDSNGRLSDPSRTSSRWVEESPQDGESFHVHAVDLRFPPLTGARLHVVLTELRGEKLTFVIPDHTLP